MHTKSLWVATTSKTSFPQLKENLSTDVAIVGGGITGLTTAILLLQAGKKVVVVDNAEIAMGETGYTSAHLTQVLDMRYHTLHSKFGEEQTRLIASSKRAAIQKIEELSLQYGISCGFQYVPGVLFSESKAGDDELNRELEAMNLAELSAEMVQGTALPFETRKALRIPHQAQFHPREYLLPLAQKIIQLGGKIYENTRVIDVQDGTPCVVSTERHKIKAAQVLLSANVPVTNWLFLNTKIAAYRTYAIAAVSNKSIPAGLYWDLQDPYHYIRSYKNLDDEEYLVIGGEDHKTGTVTDTEACFKKLEEYAKNHFDIGAIPYKWSGQIIEPVDGLPYIGLNSMSKHVYVSTGYSGNGLTYGTLGAMIVSDLILGKANPWAKLYTATRLNVLASAERFIAENAGVVGHFVADHLHPSDEHSLDNVKPEEGKVLSIQGHQIAAYRSAGGTLHCVSAICPHMKGVVHWNKAESSWDCPCHGSRFDKDGKVLNGPALTDLAPVQFPRPALASS